MKQFLLACAALLFCFPLPFFGQIPTATLVQIVKAEDERRFDKTLENLLKNPNEKIRVRAALAAGRIGDERALPALVDLLEKDSILVQATTAFAIGEIESGQGAEAITEVLKNREFPSEVRARAVEAAGKIAAAVTPTNKPMAEALRAIILTSLDDENIKPKPEPQMILLGLTAILRARPVNGEFIAAKFLTNADARVRADVLNTLARLRAKNVTELARQLLAKDTDAIVRANAARILGVAEDKTALDLLLNAATEDADSRVRVSAIRSLVNLKDVSVADKLLIRPTSIPKPTVLGTACYFAASKYLKNNPLALLECDFDLKSEMLEIASAVGRLLPNTNNQRAINFLVKFNEFDKYQSPEIEIALARIAPAKFSELQRNKKALLKNNWRAVSSMMAGIGEMANAPDSAETKPAKEYAKAIALAYIRSQLLGNQREDKTLSDALTAYAAFKTNDLPEVLREAMVYRDAVARTTAAGLLADTPSSKESIESLKNAFTKSLLTDNRENDAQLAVLDALYKLDKKESVGHLLIALNAPDYLVRKKAFQLLEDKDLQKDFPGIPASLENARRKNKDKVLPHLSYSSTKLGQILNTDADYLRAVSRKSARAVFTTSKGNFTINFFPEDAPLAVDNFIKLARTNYFNNVTIHRVVPNFVMQDGDPRGDGNGGPGWQIRCEINEFPYERGAVGMALSGKDTGGSQWFVTHSRQPHLDGGYTVFGNVNETDMKIVDNLVRGDKILRVRIVEGSLPQRIQRRRK